MNWYNKLGDSPQSGALKQWGTVPTKQSPPNEKEAYQMTKESILIVEDEEKIQRLQEAEVQEIPGNIQTENRLRLP